MVSCYSDGPQSVQPNRYLCCCANMGCRGEYCAFLVLFSISFHIIELAATETYMDKVRSQLSCVAESNMWDCRLEQQRQLPKQQSRR